MNIIAFNGAYIVGRIADQGLANVTGIETLRHGTNPISWVGIHILGALPKQMGGSKIGGDYGTGCNEQNVGRFYMEHDSFNLPNRFDTENLFKKKLLTHGVPKRYSV